VSTAAPFAHRWHCSPAVAEGWRRLTFWLHLCERLVLVAIALWLLWGSVLYTALSGAMLTSSCSGAPLFAAI